MSLITASPVDAVGAFTASHPVPPREEARGSSEEFLIPWRREVREPWWRASLMVAAIALGAATHGVLAAASPAGELAERTLSAERMQMLAALYELEEPPWKDIDAHPAFVVPLATPPVCVSDSSMAC